MLPRSERLARENSVRQDTILLEAIQRVRCSAGLREDQLHQRPLTIVVTKWDSWRELLPNLSNEPPYATVPGAPMKVLDGQRIAEVSKQVGDMLRKYTPEIVAAAGGVAQHLTFLPVSATGLAPEVDPNTNSFGIRPRNMASYWVEVPMLAALMAESGVRNSVETWNGLCKELGASLAGGLSQDELDKLVKAFADLEIVLVGLPDDGVLVELKELAERMEARATGLDSIAEELNNSVISELVTLDEPRSSKQKIVFRKQIRDSASWPPAILVAS